MKSFEEFLKEREKIVKEDICYLDDEGKVVDKKNATKFIVTEYDKYGNIINSVYGICNKDIEEEER